MGLKAEIVGGSGWHELGPIECNVVVNGVGVVDFDRGCYGGVLGMADHDSGKLPAGPGVAPTVDLPSEAKVVDPTVLGHRASSADNGLILWEERPRSVCWRKIWNCWSFMMN